MSLLSFLDHFPTGRLVRVGTSSRLIVDETSSPWANLYARWWRYHTRHAVKEKRQTKSAGGRDSRGDAQCGVVQEREGGRGSPGRTIVDGLGLAPPPRHTLAAGETLEVEKAKNLDAWEDDQQYRGHLSACEGPATRADVSVRSRPNPLPPSPRPRSRRCRDRADVPISDGNALMGSEDVLMLMGSRDLDVDGRDPDCLDGERIGVMTPTSSSSLSWPRSDDGPSDRDADCSLDDSKAVCRSVVG